MLKRMICMMFVFTLMLSSGCATSEDIVKIGVSFGVGEADRWKNEREYMEARAKALNAEIEINYTASNDEVSQKDACFKMIDQGIDVLIIITRNADDFNEILNYAHDHNVYVINYARPVLNEPMDLFIGYDCLKIGRMVGQFLVETVYEGDYIVLRGDEKDYNSELLYQGAMSFIETMDQEIQVILDAPVPNWSSDKAYKLVRDAIVANDNKIDAILAPNDKIAETCYKVLTDLGIKEHVVITGMDAELTAIQRIVAGTQDITFYMDLKELASVAIDEAYHIAEGNPAHVNAHFDNLTDNGTDAILFSGKIVTKENIDKILIESGFYSKEQVYESKRAD